jgi:hypothetical protein
LNQVRRTAPTDRRGRKPALRPEQRLLAPIFVIADVGLLWSIGLDPIAM